MTQNNCRIALFTKFLLITIHYTLINQLYLVNCVCPRPSNVTYETEETVTVTLSSGTVLGTVFENAEGFKAQAFSGIPYAKAERFQAPQPVTSFENYTDGNGTFDATKQAPVCPAFFYREAGEALKIFIEYFGIQILPGESEDCLRVDVVAPLQMMANDSLATGTANEMVDHEGNEVHAVPVEHFAGAFGVGTEEGEIRCDACENGYPVVIWIDGVSFMYRHYDPLAVHGVIDNFVSKGVIFVGVTYRLGPLGFYTDMDSDSSLNLGLEDIMSAIKWVHENIRAFGGNPNKVTLMGHGSGAIAASLVNVAMAEYTNLPIRASELHRNKKYSPARPNPDPFQNLILLSGSGLAPYAQNVTAKVKAFEKLREAADCPENQDTLECLKTADLMAMQLAVSKMPEDLLGIFGPTMDVDMQHMQVIADRMRNQSHANVLMGVTADETLAVLPLLFAAGYSDESMGRGGGEQMSGGCNGIHCFAKGALAKRNMTENDGGMMCNGKDCSIKMSNSSHMGISDEMHRENMEEQSPQCMIKDVLKNIAPENFGEVDVFTLIAFSHYVDNVGDRDDPIVALRAALDIANDHLYYVPSTKEAYLRAASGMNDVFLYEFGTLPDSLEITVPLPGFDVRGAYHGIDLGYLFRAIPQYEFTEDDCKLIDDFTDSVVNFIKTGITWVRCGDEGCPQNAFPTKTECENTCVNWQLGG